MGHKNIIGAFYQPKLVLIDTLLLKTLPLRQLKNGYGEIIKHALISSQELFDLIKKNKLNITDEIIYKNLLIKANKVIEDEKDNNERQKLNFGHTFGHIIELKELDLLHGEAVLSGILAILDYEIDLGYDVKNIKKEVLSLYKELELNYKEYDYKTLLDEVKFDKKNFSGNVNFIFIDKIGNSFIEKREAF